MFKIRFGDEGQIIPSGRLDAAQCPTAESFLEDITESCVVDLCELRYISSAGLGVLLSTQKRLKTSGQKLRIINPSNSIRDILRYSGLDQVFDVH